MTQAGFKDTTGPQVLLQTATNNLSQGFDIASSDLYKWTNGVTTASGTIQLAKTIAGVFTYPVQPCFQAYLPTTTAGVTGAGATATLGAATAFTATFDQASNLSSLNPVTFVAPESGRYLFECTVTFSTITIATANLFTITIATSNATYNLSSSYTPTQTSLTLNLSAIADMDALDTCTFTGRIAGMAGNTATFAGEDGTGTRATVVSGKLLC
jgi:hypothetical protein